MKYELITDYRELQPADQIVVKQPWGNLGKSLGVLYPVISDRPYYFHHGIYMGQSKVVEFNGPNKANAKLCEVSLGTFRTHRPNAEQRPLFRVNYGSSKILLPHQTIQRAKDLINASDNNHIRPKFNIFWNNCETMATYLKTNRKRSYQTRSAMLRAISILLNASYAICVARILK